jgi:hypothetical protein
MESVYKLLHSYFSVVFHDFEVAFVLDMEHKRDSVYQQLTLNCVQTALFL